MADEDPARMHIRTRRGKRGTRPGPSAEAKPQPMAATPPGQDCKSEYARFEESYAKLGVAKTTLNRLFDRAGMADFEDLHENVTSIQLARMGACTARQTEGFEQRLQTTEFAEIGEELLDAALKLKPVDTIERMMDMYGNHPGIREAHRLIRENKKITAAWAEEKPQAAEAVRQFRELVEGDVQLLAEAHPGPPNDQIAAISILARRCFDTLRTMVMERDERSKSKQPKPPLTNHSLSQQTKGAAGQQRITEETMEAYRREGQLPGTGKK